MLTFIEACATIKSTIHAATDMVMRTIVMCSFYTCYEWALIKITHLNNFHLAFYAYNLISTTKQVFYLLYIYSHNSYFYTMVRHTNDKNTEFY